MSDLKIKKSSVIYLFQRNQEIRKAVFEYEKELQDQFVVPFEIVNISDEGNPDIVRFHSVSLNGFSKLLVSQQKLIIETNYSEDFFFDIAGIREYLVKKISFLKPLLEKEKLQYIGFIFTIDKELSSNEVLPFIKDTVELSTIIDESTTDFRYYYAKSIGDDYYINVQIGKFEQITEKVESDRIGAVVNAEIQSRETGIIISVDFNNKKVEQQGRDFNFDDSFQVIDDFFEILAKNQIENYLLGTFKQTLYEVS